IFNSSSLYTDIVKSFLRFGQNSPIAKFNELLVLLVLLTNNSFKLVPLFSRNFINNSSSGADKKNLKICSCGKVAYCNVLKSFKYSLRSNDKIISCKCVKLEINSKGI